MVLLWRVRVFLIFVMIFMLFEKLVSFLGLYFFVFCYTQPHTVLKWAFLTDFFPSPENFHSNDIVDFFGFFPSSLSIPSLLLYKATHICTHTNTLLSKHLISEKFNLACVVFNVLDQKISSLCFLTFSPRFFSHSPFSEFPTEFRDQPVFFPHRNYSFFPPPPREND